MVEDTSGNNNSSEGRTFNISEKHLPTSAGWVGTGIAQNMQELFPTQDQGYIIRQMITGFDPHLRGMAALQESWGQALKHTVDKLSWKIDTPEVVYMSGFIAVHSVSQHLTNLTSWREQVEKGERIIDPKKGKEEILSHTQQETEKLANLLSSLETTLEAYRQEVASTHSQFDNPVYIDVIKGLLFMRGEDKRKVIDFFLKSEFDQALEVITHRRTQQVKKRLRRDL